MTLSLDQTPFLTTMPLVLGSQRFLLRAVVGVALAERHRCLEGGDVHADDNLSGVAVCLPWLPAA